MSDVVSRLSMPKKQVIQPYRKNDWKGVYDSPGAKAFQQSETIKFNNSIEMTLNMNNQTQNINNNANKSKSLVRLSSYKEQDKSKTS